VEEVEHHVVVVDSVQLCVLGSPPCMWMLPRRVRMPFALALFEVQGARAPDGGSHFYMLSHRRRAVDEVLDEVLDAEMVAVPYGGNRPCTWNYLRRAPTSVVQLVAAEARARCRASDTLSGNLFPL